MKKTIIISLALIFCLSFLVIAEADLVIDNFVVRQDNPEARGSYHYVLDVKNIGDEAISTCLPIDINFEDELSPKYPTCLLSTLTNPRGDGSNVAAVTIISEGSKIQVTPSKGEVEYMTLPLTQEEIEKQKDNAKSGFREYTEEELVDTLASIEKAGLVGYENSLDTFLVELQPGDTLRYESENSFNEIEQVTIPPLKLSLDKWELTANLVLDQFGTANENQDNNDFSEVILVEPTVLQGPKESSSENVKLDDENEYFAITSGCALVQGKEICVSLDDPNIPDEDESLIISVDGDEEVYSYSGLFAAWFYKWFGDGRLAPAEVNNGVEIIIYQIGFKFTFI